MHLRQWLCDLKSRREMCALPSVPVLHLAFLACAGPATQDYWSSVRLDCTLPAFVSAESNLQHITRGERHQCKPRWTSSSLGGRGDRWVCMPALVCPSMRLSIFPADGLSFAVGIYCVGMSRPIMLIILFGTRTFIWPPHLFDLQENPNIRGSEWVDSGLIGERCTV